MCFLNPLYIESKSQSAIKHTVKPTDFIKYFFQVSGWNLVILLSSTVLI